MENGTGQGHKTAQHDLCPGSRNLPPACKAARPAQAWPYPRILAHRGGGSLAPENTMAALQCAFELGFSAVEVDAMLSRDGVPVLMHDSQFGRTVFACGNVSDFDAAELIGMDAGSWHGERFTGEGVPLLTDALGYGAALGIWMNVEIKPAPGNEAETGRRVAAEVAAFCATRQDLYGCKAVSPLLSSFSMEALTAAAAESPAIPRALLLAGATADWLPSLKHCGAVALHIHHAALTAPLAASVKAAGYGLMCYTVNEAARARELLEWGVDAICTDCLHSIGPDFVNGVTGSV